MNRIRLEIKNLVNNNKSEFVGTREGVDEFKLQLPQTYELVSEAQIEGATLLRNEERKEFSNATKQYETINLYVYEMPMQYEFIEYDYEEEEKIEKNIKKIDFAIKLFAKFAARNTLRYERGEMTIPQIIAVEEKTAKMQRLLMNSSTSLALGELDALDDSELPASEKQFFRSEILNFLGAL